LHVDPDPVLHVYAMHRFDDSLYPPLQLTHWLFAVNDDFDTQVLQLVPDPVLQVNDAEKDV
jgi:hypothetical protein